MKLREKLQLALDALDDIAANTSDGWAKGAAEDAAKALRQTDADIKEAIRTVEHTGGIFTELGHFDSPVCLDGHFDADDLEAIAIVMRAARQENLDHG